MEKTEFEVICDRLDDMEKRQTNGGIKSILYPILTTVIGIALGFCLNLVTVEIRDQGKAISTNTAQISALEATQKAYTDNQVQMLSSIKGLSDKLDRYVERQ